MTQNIERETEAPDDPVIHVVPSKARDRLRLWQHARIRRRIVPAAMTSTVFALAVWAWLEDTAPSSSSGDQGSDRLTVSMRECGGAPAMEKTGIRPHRIAEDTYPALPLQLSDRLSR